MAPVFLGTYVNLSTGLFKFSVWVYVTSTLGGPMNISKIFLFVLLSLNMNSLYAQIETQVLESNEPINVDGYVTEKQQMDGELANLKQEIEKQKRETVLNRQKAKEYQVLSKSVEKLSETTEEYLEEKKSAKAEIANYNAKVRCLQEEAPGPDCDKFVKRR